MSFTCPKCNSVRYLYNTYTNVNECLDCRYISDETNKENEK